jgi:hypothetical protein
VWGTQVLPDQIVDVLFTAIESGARGMACALARPYHPTWEFNM